MDFSGPKSVARWAGDAINDFHAAEAAYFRANPGQRYSVLDYWACHIVHGIRFTARPGDELQRAAYRIVSDLRNALDQAVHAASLSLGTTHPTKTNFPFRRSEREFWTSLKADGGSHRGIPSQLHPLLGSFEPFPRPEGEERGNNLLYALCTVANPNKHQLPLGVEAQTAARVYRMDGTLRIGTLWDGKGHTELYRTVPGEPHDVEMVLEPRIAFGEAVPLLAGKPALTTFHEFRNIVDRIISDLEAETARLRTL